MKPFLTKTTFLFALAVGLTIGLVGCSDPKPTVIEPSNADELEMMRAMVEAESTAEDATDAHREP